MVLVHLDLVPLKPEDIPDASSSEFQEFLDAHFEAGLQLAETMAEWKVNSVKHDGTVQVVDLPSSSSYGQIRRRLNVKEYWCGRQTHHTSEELRSLSQQPRPTPASRTPAGLVRSLSQRFSKRPEEVNGAASASASEGLNGSAVDDADESTEVERQARVMSSVPHGLYERFRRGLLEYHSENEREYIESMRETQCLHVYQRHVAEVWRLTFKTPPPTNPRTFVVLLLSRELASEPTGQRSFMNISLPFVHPDCPEKTGNEKSRVRGKYVSVERVRETQDGTVEWKMATSSDAGGNIPRFVTNSSLPSNIAEDVPSFLKWMVRRFPEGGDVASQPVPAA